MNRKRTRGKQNWQTPKIVFNNLNKITPFCIDLAADAKNALCTNYFDETDNALDIDWNAWYNTRVASRQFSWDLWGFLNPPFANLAPWYQKCYEEQEKGFQTVMLVQASTDPQYFHDFILGDKCPKAVAFSKGRIQYVDPDNPGKKNCGFGSMVIWWSPHAQKKPDFLSISKEGVLL